MWTLYSFCDIICGSGGVKWRSALCGCRIWLAWGRVGTVSSAVLRRWKDTVHAKDDGVLRLEKHAESTEQRGVVEARSMLLFMTCEMHIVAWKLRRRTFFISQEGLDDAHSTEIADGALSARRRDVVSRGRSGAER